MYIKEFKRKTTRQGFTFQKGFKALLNDNGRILAATSGFAIYEGWIGSSKFDPDDYKVRYYLRDEAGEWYPISEQLYGVRYTFGRRSENEALYKMLRQGPDEEIAYLKRQPGESPRLDAGRFYRVVSL